MPNDKPNGIVLRGDMKRIRAMGMLELRVKGYTHEEIASEYRCSTDTVARQLAWAAREGQILKHEEDILSRLVPKAIKTYEEALDKGDVFVAKDLFAMLSRLSERVDKRQEHVEELSLAAYLKTRRRTENPEQARANVEVIEVAHDAVSARVAKEEPGEGQGVPQEVGGEEPGVIETSEVVGPAHVPTEAAVRTD